MTTSGATDVKPLSAWLILVKPLVRDQLTLEVGMRVSSAVRLLRTRAPPDVMVFCGGGLGEPPASAERRKPTPSVLSSAALAYHIFRTAAEAQGWDVSRVRFIVEEHSGAREGALSASIALRSKLRSAQRMRATAAIHRAAASPSPPPPIEVTVISTGHHLQRLRDIDTLTPRQSCLGPLHDLSASISCQPAPDPYSFSADADERRQRRHVRLADKLAVLLVNLQGLETHTEFLCAGE